MPPLHAPRLIIVTDTRLAPPAVLSARIAATLSAAAPGSVMVQLRDRDLPARERLAFGKELAAACHRSVQPFVVNDRLDLAVLLGADGVHLGEASVLPEDARVLLGVGAFVSVAWHDASTPPPRGADAALLSPIIAPRKGREALGIRALAAARERLDEVGAGRLEPSRTRLYALGGVDAESAAACVAGGADGVAVVTAALDGRDVLPLLEALQITR